MVKQKTGMGTITWVMIAGLTLGIQRASLSAEPGALVQEPTEKDLDQARTERIEALPGAQADYVFGVDQAKPACDGLTGIRTLKDYFGQGADGLEIQPYNDGANATMPAFAYWRLTGITPGKYYLGLWLDSAEESFQTEYSLGKMLTTVYVNGWPVRFTTASDPVQVQKGRWLVELQTAAPVELKPGDEVALRPWRRVTTCLRLALHRKEPRRGHGVTGQTFGTGQNDNMLQRLRLLVKPEILGPGEDGTEHTARISVGNPLPYAADAVMTWKLADYFGTQLTGRTERIHIEPHQQLFFDRGFIARSEDQAYQLDVRMTPAPGWRAPVARPEEWLELNDYTRIQFQPNLPGPLDVWSHVRVDLNTRRIGVRRWLSLDGSDWERAPMEGRRVPTSVPRNLAYSRFTIPFLTSWSSLPKGVFGMWYRKTFRAPEWLRGEALILDVHRAACEGTVFLNGQRIGYGVGGDLAIQANATRAIRWGEENELVICVRNAIALMKPEYVDRYDPAASGDAEVNQTVAGNKGNYALLGSVRLCRMPAVRISQSLVVPDVERNTLLVWACLENLRDMPVQMDLRCAVSQDGLAARVDFPAKKVTLAAHGKSEVRVVGQVVGGLRPYTMLDPALAKITLTLEEQGTVRDVCDQRFGYRTVKVDGPRLTLNGKPVTLLGTGPAFGRLEHLERESGTDVSRGLDGPGSLAWQDEVGRFYYVPIADTLVESWDKLNNTNYWNSARSNAVETVRKLGSMPAVIGWDVANETYLYSVYSVGKEGQARGGELLGSVAQAIRQAVWPDYWFFSDGNMSLGGRLNFFSWHYLNHGGCMASYNAGTSGFGEYANGVSHYPPDCFFVNGASQPPQQGTVVSSPGGDWTVGSGVACGDTEEFWFVDKINGLCTSKYLGDRAAVSSGWQYQTPRGMWWTKLAVDGYRDMEQTLIAGIYWQSAGFMHLVTQDVTFSLPQQAVRYYAGALFDKRLTLHDDEFRPGRLAFTWELLDPQGRIVRNGRIGARSNTAFLKRDRIAFDVPQVSKRTPFTLDMRLVKDGTLRAREQRVVDVWPALGPNPGLAASPLGIALFDPGNTVAPALAKIGVTTHPVARLEAAALKNVKVLIVGPDCVTGPMPAEQTLLRDFVASGGRALVLDQTEFGLLPGNPFLEKRGHVTMGFVRASNHPVMQGLEDVDFQMWNPGHLIARGVYRKPEGNALALVDCSTDGTMAWSPLFESYVGQGSVVVCQLPLVANLATEPMAAELWRRLLAYAAAPVYHHPASRLAVLAGASTPVLQRLREIRAEFDTVNAPDNSRPVTLLDMNRDDFSGQTAAFRAYVEQGGTLMLHRVKPAHATWLGDLVRRKVTMTVQPYQGWVDRRMLERRDGLVEGLNNVDFYWRPHIGGEGWDSVHQVSAGVLNGKGQVAYVVKIDGAADYLFPGGLLEVPVGRGRVVIDQLKWELPDQEQITYGSPKRVIAALLGNLGIVQRLPSPKPTLPAQVRYESIDISAVANRALRDDVPGDGVGWMDWGPSSDIRDFQTGQIILGGVPFLVPAGERNAIVLRLSTQRNRGLDTLPAAVTIPVGRKEVLGLWFLHTGGWAFGRDPFGYRIIRYADGTEEQMLLNGTNMGDWNYGHDEFPDEEGTTTTVAWKGSCKMNPVTRVYKTLWLNPHPEKEIKEVVITTEGLPEVQWRFNVHLGLTVALRAQNEATVRDAARAETLVKEALGLVTAGKTADAASRLEEALKADDRNVTAWMTMTTLRAGIDTVEAFTALCQRWFQAMPENYQAHNVLGRFLETKGKSAEALAEYKKSLQLEWNQPPISELVNRLEKKAAQ
jgi:hypothetical protein